jgi:hypothetical protein
VLTCRQRPGSWTATNRGSSWSASGDGWAGIRGGDGAWVLNTCDGTATKGPQIAPAFPTSVLHGPKVVVPNRAYFLFRGSISDFGDWGAADDQLLADPLLDVVPADPHEEQPSYE